MQFKLIAFSLLWVVCLLSISGLLQAESFTLLRKKQAELELVVDGKLDEPIWEEAKSWTDFLVIDPGSLATPIHKTDLRLFYSERGLYLGIYAHQPPDTLVKRLSSRDKRVNRDEVSLSLDTSGSGLYGSFFSIKLGNSLSDGVILPERRFSSEWDGVWWGRSVITDFGWTAEYLLPWSTFSMPLVQGNERNMAFYVSRKVAYLNERWGFPPLPTTQPLFISSFEPITLKSVEANRQVDLRPFVSADYDNSSNSGRLKVGTDLFFRPKPNLQLSATLFPDFGVTESDDVIVSLSALEVFFKERRDFFLEGQEIFNTSPRSDSRYNKFLLLNTRRIGQPVGAADSLPADFEESNSELLQPVDLYGAVKLTGQIAQLRYGLFSAFEQDTNVTQSHSSDNRTLDRKVDGQSFGALRLLYEPKLKSGYSALGFINTVVTTSDEDVHVQGLDVHGLSAKGQWQVDSQFMHSKVKGRHGFGALVDLIYNPVQGKRHSLTTQWFDEDFEVNDLGFSSRNDQFGLQYRFERTRTNLKRLRETKVHIQVVQNWNNNKDLVRSGWFSGINIKTNKLHTIVLDAGWFPGRWEDQESEGNGTFRLADRGRASVSWETNTGKKLVHKLKYSLLDESLGARSHRLDTDWTFRPSGSFSAEFKLAHRKRNDWLVYSDDKDFTTYNARYWQSNINLNFFFDAQKQFSTSLQWIGIKANEADYYRVPDRRGQLVKIAQSGNSNRDFGLSVLTWQVRYRWQFLPLSELTIVYHRAANITGSADQSVDELFSGAFNNPLINSLIMKLTYNFSI